MGAVTIVRMDCAAGLDQGLIGPVVVWVLLGVAGLIAYGLMRRRGEPSSSARWQVLVMLWIATLVGILLLHRAGSTTHRALQSWGWWRRQLHESPSIQALAWGALAGTAWLAGATAVLGYRVHVGGSRLDRVIAGGFLIWFAVLLILKAVFHAVLPVLLGSGLLLLSLFGIRRQLKTRRKVGPGSQEEQ